MRKVSDRKIMRALYCEYKGNYAKMAKWLKGSKSWGDGTYNYEFPKKCPTCGQIKS